MSSETTLNGPGFANITPLLSPSGNWTVNKSNVLHLTQEKPPASQQVSSEDPDSISIQEVRLQEIEAIASTGITDKQEVYE